MNAENEVDGFPEISELLKCTFITGNRCCSITLHFSTVVYKRAIDYQEYESSSSFFRVYFLPICVCLLISAIHSNSIWIGG